MSQRFFEGSQHASLYAQFRPSPPQALADRIVGFLKEKYNGDLNLVLDVGCGQGQACALFASQFEKVLATDVSPMMINAAKLLNHPPNVQFQIGSAEKLEAKTGSAQLVNSSVAAHWFDLPSFFKEVDRVLCSKGVVALSCYGENSFVVVHPTKGKSLQEELMKVFNVKLGPFRGGASKGIEIALGEYHAITIPYENSIREDVWTSEKTLSLAELTLFITTFWPFQNFKKINGETAAHELLDTFTESCKQILETDDAPEKVELQIKVKYFVLMGRKP